MRSTLGTARRLGLGACLVIAGQATLLAVPRISAAFSTWSWQSVGAITCPAVTVCTAVGYRAAVPHGLVVTTHDGGQHWTARPTGTMTGLGGISCPEPVLCYAFGVDVSGRPPKLHVQDVIVRSADGGRTWRQPAAHLPVGGTEVLSWLTCPSARICLTGGGAITSGADFLLRTADGGRTWHTVRIGDLQGYVAVTCATVTVCYAGVSLNGNSDLARSGDSGKTWTVQGLTSPQGLTRPELANSSMACPGANTCFATALDCGGFACSVGHIYLTRDGARTWQQLRGGTIGGIVCPSATTCYARAVRSVLSTSNGGRTWSAHRLPGQEFSLACASPTTCFALTRGGLLTTSDGFGHTR